MKLNNMHQMILFLLLLQLPYYFFAYLAVCSQLLDYIVLIYILSLSFHWWQKPHTNVSLHMTRQRTDVIGDWFK